MTDQEIFLHLSTKIGELKASVDGLRALSQSQFKALQQSVRQGHDEQNRRIGELGARVSALLILVCALPFCAPITIPGLSTPFGLVIAFARRSVEHHPLHRFDGRTETTFIDRNQE